MKRILIILFILLTFGYASDLENLKKDIQQLSSKKSNGRGLNGEGIYYAEKYIVSELQKAGLDLHTQAVKYKQNIVTDSPICVIDGDTLRPGYDYIPHPFSASCDKIFSKEEIEFVDSAKLAEVKGRHGLSSLSSARRFLIKKSKKKDHDKLLLFSGACPLMSKQSKRSRRAILQVDKNILDHQPTLVYMYLATDYKKVTTNNIIVVIKGRDKPDSAICFSAHYDHMGALGDVYYPGANDNASGVAVLMSLARHYADNPPSISLVFCFFTGEEQGLKGSWRYVKKPVFPLKNTCLAINLDMVGSGQEGYGIVGGNEQPAEVSIFEDIREEYGIGNLKLRNNSPNSDHFPFSDRGVPALFFYSSGGEQPYHHPDDIPETLDWEALENTILLMKNYVERKIEN